jgi:hypothetical protein
MKRFGASYLISNLDVTNLPGPGVKELAPLVVILRKQRDYMLGTLGMLQYDFGRNNLQTETISRKDRAIGIPRDYMSRPALAGEDIVRAA